MLNELEELEQEELDAKMLETPSPVITAPNVPVHVPGKIYIKRERKNCYITCICIASRTNDIEDDEEAELKALQASMAM